MCRRYMLVFLICSGVLFYDAVMLTETRVLVETETETSECELHRAPGSLSRPQHAQEADNDCLAYAIAAPTTMRGPSTPPVLPRPPPVPAAPLLRMRVLRSGGQERRHWLVMNMQQPSPKSMYSRRRGLSSERGVPAGGISASTQAQAFFSYPSRPVRYAVLSWAPF